MNFLVEKHALVRTDQPGFSTYPRSQLINSIDILRARLVTGLMTRDNYRTVNNITLGKHPEKRWKLSLMLEADRINVQALNMGQIVVDVDGVNLTELINKVAENGYSLRVVEESDQQSTCTLPPFATLAGIRRVVPHISRKRITPGCTRCRIRPVTLIIRTDSFHRWKCISGTYRCVVISGSAA